MSNQGNADGGPRRDFYLSYSDDDREWARWVAARLVEAGYQVVVGGGRTLSAPGETSVSYGRPEDASRTVVLASRSYFRSVFAQVEWHALVSAGPAWIADRVIPVRLEDCELPGLPAPASTIDLFGHPSGAGRQVLLDGIARLAPGRAGHDVPPSQPAGPPPPGAGPVPAAPQPSHAAAAQADNPWRPPGDGPWNSPGAVPFHPGSPADVVQSGPGAARAGGRTRRRNVLALAIGLLLVAVAAALVVTLPGSGETTASPEPGKAAVSPVSSAPPFDVRAALERASRAPYSATSEMESYSNGVLGLTSTMRTNVGGPSDGSGTVRMRTEAVTGRAGEVEIVAVSETEVYMREVTPGAETEWLSVPSTEAPISAYTAYPDLLLAQGPKAHVGLEQLSLGPAYHLSGEVAFEQLRRINPDVYAALNGLPDLPETFLIDVWIDPDGRIARAELNLRYGSEDVHTVVSVTSFGPPFEVRRPS